MNFFQKRRKDDEVFCQKIEELELERCFIQLRDKLNSLKIS